jgi:uncharacterized protein YndB with AHSA1/START domain
MFDAPRELIWRAPVCEMDVRPGGTWYHLMQAPNGPQFTVDSGEP